MKAEETGLVVVRDMLGWALARLHYDFAYSLEDLQKVCENEIFVVTESPKEQTRSTLFYSNANDIIENGVKGR